MTAWDKLAIAAQLGDIRPYSWVDSLGSFGITVPPTRAVEYRGLTSWKRLAVSRNDVRLAATVLSIQADLASRV